MQVTIVPFFSQQNKMTGKFLLHSCGTTKICRFLAEQLRQFLLWDVRLVVPHQWLCEDDPLCEKSLVGWADQMGVRLIDVYVPPNNLYQRLSFRPDRMAEVLNGSQLVINFHELWTFPIKALDPTRKVIHFNALPADEPWPWMAPAFYLNWQMADLITCYSQAMKEYIERTMRDRADIPRISPWPMAYLKRALDVFDAGVFDSRRHRDIDLLFVQRCSVTNYTRHEQFLAAVQILREQGWEGTVAMTDVTRYLRAKDPGLLEKLEIEVFAHPESQVEYVRFLHRAKAVIGLNENKFGGMSFYEAVYCGAFPIVTLGYQDLIGNAWPSQIPDVTPVNIVKEVSKFLWNGKDPWDHVTPFVRQQIQDRVELRSFEHVWNVSVASDLIRLMSEESIR